MNNQNRPLSPHIGIYKWRITMLLSIIHRATGVALATGTLLIAFWVICLSQGEAAFECAQRWLLSPLGILVLIGFAWAFFYHLCNGIRHLFWDAGYGYDLKTSTNSAWAVVIGSLVLTVLAIATAII